MATVEEGGDFLPAIDAKTPRTLLVSIEVQGPKLHAISVILVWAALSTALWGLARHTSKSPTVFDRFSVRHAILVGSVATGWLILSVVFLKRSQNRFKGATFCVPLVHSPVGRGVLMAFAGISLPFVLVFGETIGDLSQKAFTFPVLLAAVVAAFGVVCSVAARLEPRVARLSLFKVTLVVGSTSAALFLVEIGIRSYSVTQRYLVLAPNTSAEFQPNEDSVPGIHDVTHFTTTSDGLRGSPYPSGDSAVRILAIGGSTTECRLLDDNETWPHLVEEHLNREKEVSYWVGNAGSSGLQTPHHIIAAERIFDQLPCDIAIYLVGINDLSPYLRYGRAPASPPLWWVTWAFSQRPIYDRYAETSFFRKWGLCNLLWLRDKVRPSGESLQDSAGASYDPRRLLWRERPPAPELPDLQDALRKYDDDLTRLIAATRNSNVTPVLLTQPVLWSSKLGEESRRLLWMAYKGRPSNPTHRYEPSQSREAMDLFNEKLFEVGQRENVTVIDLSVLSGESDYFYDDCHFTESGAQAVAELAAPALRGVLQNRRSHALRAD